MRSLLVVFAFVAQLLIAPALAQDRPLFQPLRIGYPSSGSFGEQLMSNETLDHDLRRIGLIASWHAFDDGLGALRALHAEEIDIALDIRQHEVILAKLEDLSMVFVAERKSRDSSETDQIFPDDEIRRYTLTSEYFADHREDALLLVFRALQNAARTTVHSGTNDPRHLIRVTRFPGPREQGHQVNIATRQLLLAGQKAADKLWASGHVPRQVDFADVNYWMPPADLALPANVSTR